MGSRPIVTVIEDNDAMRDALASLLGMCGYEVRSHAAATAFLERLDRTLTGCIVLDVRMPEIDGLAFQRRMAAEAIELPVIFISGHADVALSVRAMRQGAFTFLTKPFREQDLLDAVAEAVALEADTRPLREERRRVRDIWDTLTPRDRDVMRAVTHGEANKLIAARLGLSEISIKVIRAGLMRKIGAGSVAELSQLAERCGLG